MPPVYPLRVFILSLKLRRQNTTWSCQLLPLYSFHTTVAVRDCQYSAGNDLLYSQYRVTFCDCAIVSVAHFLWHVTLHIPWARRTYAV